MSPSTHPARRTPAVPLAALLAGVGVLHFARPEPFDAIVPRALAGGPRPYTYASGVAEVAVAALLAAPPTRRLGGGLAVALFAAVFPANVQMTVDWLRSDRIPAAGKVVAVARLPLQIPLVAAAWRVRRDAR